MGNNIITIARGYGSGGRSIGQKLAKEMGIAYYDRNIIYLTSDKSGLDPNFFSMHDENVKPGFFEKLTTFASKNIPLIRLSALSTDNGSPGRIFS